MTDRNILCPSSGPDLNRSEIFGVLAGTAANPEVRFLPETVPLSSDVVEASGPVTIGEVLRLSGPCVKNGCLHFQHRRCKVADAVSRHLSAVVLERPDCPIRSDCRWWKQMGDEICFKCPQVTTAVHRGAVEKLLLESDC